MDDVIDHPTAATDETLALRRPDVPVTLDELAVREEKAHAIQAARIRILETARLASIRMTHPEDWVLFQTRDGLVTGYLQDSGCERVRDVFGISVSNVSNPEKITGAVAGDFHYVVRGDGHSTLTGQTIEGLEGGRSSTEDFCKDKSGAALELAVRKAARANLDGSIVRELAGLARVPISELEAAWSGTHKRTDRCVLGRGFGGKAERMGARAVAEGETREAPKCDVCGATAQFQPAGRTTTGKTYEAFWGCPKKGTHADRKWTLDDAKWREQLQAREKTPPPAEPSKTEATQKQPLTADDVFGREPGQEG